MTAVWEEEYRKRSEAGDLRAVLDPADPTGRKNPFYDRIDRIHLGLVLGNETLETVVELGCGLGRLTAFIAGRARRVIGLDGSPEMLGLAKARVNRRGASFVRADIRALPVRDGAADLVLGAAVMLHMVEARDIESCAAETRRVLRPGGRAVFLENLAPGDQSLWREGVVHRSPSDFTLPFTDRGFRVVVNRPIRKAPSRIVHWVDRGRVPRFAWGLVARLEPWFAVRGSEPPKYREHLVVLQKAF